MTCRCTVLQFYCRYDMILTWLGSKSELGLVQYMRNRLNSSCRSLLVRRSFFLKGAPNHGKRYGELSKAIPCNILKYISSLIIACKTWNCSFFCTFSPVPKRYPKRYLSDTLLVHKCSLIHPVPRNQKETKSRLKRPMNTDNYKSI